MSEQEYKTILARYLPASAVDPVYRFIVEHNIHFRITRERASKLGDYKMPQPRHQYHEISVNGNLSTHFFLLVLLHEMAHLLTFLSHGRKIQPHGHEWQGHYRDLLLEYSCAGHFPPETKPLIMKYTAHIPLNRAAGQELEKLVKQLDNPGETIPITTLDDIPLGSTFRIVNKPRYLFRSISKNRTRYRCLELQTQQTYSISASAEVSYSNGFEKLKIENNNIISWITT